uniref:Pyroglutamyl-peptidase I n=1 Tax=Panagrolaimus superbus TaxID=310955 RepID=A0A914YF08_9BILA
MPLIPPIKRKKLVVTGYGPFGNYEENPSSIIVKKLKETGLPDDLKVDYELETHLLDVAYDKADTFVCDNVQKKPAHFYIHIGVHPFKKIVKLEQQSSSDGYCRKDINGTCPSNDRACVAPNCGTTEKLQSSFDCKKAVNNIKPKFADTHIIIESSIDPGNYLCGYIFYCTLKANNGKSLFIHIPTFDETSKPETIQKIVEEIIREVLKQCP